MAKKKSKDESVQVEIEVRPGVWVKGNKYKSLREALLGLSGEKWRIEGEKRS